MKQLTKRQKTIQLHRMIKNEVLNVLLPNLLFQAEQAVNELKSSDKKLQENNEVIFERLTRFDKL